jgi:hypothetical protein
VGPGEGPLLCGLGAVMRCQCIMLTSSRTGLKIHVFGYASDIERADLNGAVGYQKCLNAWPAALSVVSLYG